MNIDFYLSEMSISNQHGGGLTLQRVLGSDIQNIQYFIHASKFADEMPADANLKATVIKNYAFWDTNAARTIAGRTFALRMRKKQSVVKKHAVKLARLTAQTISKEGTITGLVCPQGIDTLYILEEIRKVKAAEYITWIMDDHLLQYSKDGWYYPEGVEAIFASHLRNAKHVLVISPAMQAFYKQRFDIESTVLFGPADFTASIYNSSTNKPLRIGYFGALAAWQTDVLAAVAAAIQNSNASLDIYSGVNALPKSVAQAGVELKGRLDASQVLKAMQHYDAILLPISFNESLRNMSEFNIATKMSECLACGVPILAVGPHYAAMIKYLEMHNAAIVVKSTNSASLSAALDTLKNEKEIEAILAAAKSLVKAETSVAAMKSKWKTALNRLNVNDDHPVTY